MSEDMVAIWRGMEQYRKDMRRDLGIPCPGCVKQFPKANPKILVPGQYCKRHKYTDPRPESVTDDWAEKIYGATRSSK
jgi:hypothetical protein